MKGTSNDRLGKITEDELDLMVAILRRYEKETNTTFPSDEWRTRLMDIHACHANGCPLDLEAMLTMPLPDFAHDIGGITKHINRATGKLGGCFVPRAAKKEPLQFPPRGPVPKDWLGREG